jgi:hypothetical protein
MDKAKLGFTTIRRRINSCTRNSIQHGICPIIRQLAVAMMQTATRRKSSTSTATSTRNAEKTESTFPFHRKRWSGTETTQMAEITSALPRRMPSAHPIPCSASLWGAPHEIRIGKWEVAPAAIPLCDVRPTDRSKLPAGNRDAPHLLQSQLLRGSLQERDPASRKSGKRVRRGCKQRRSTDEIC